MELLKCKSNIIFLHSIQNVINVNYIVHHSPCTFPMIIIFPRDILRYSTSCVSRQSSTNLFQSVCPVCCNNVYVYQTRAFHLTRQMGQCYPQWLGIGGEMDMWDGWRSDISIHIFITCCNKVIIQHPQLQLYAIMVVHIVNCSTQHVYMSSLVIVSSFSTIPQSDPI